MGSSSLSTVTTFALGTKPSGSAGIVLFLMIKLGLNVQESQPHMVADEQSMHCPSLSLLYPCPSI
eukprot:5330791-Amphidinium_carterae.1